MDKKWIIAILIIILIAIGLIAYFSITNQENEVKIGDTTFHLPNGYHVTNSTNKNATNLTNGTHNIYIEKYDNANIKKIIKGYVDFSKNNNHTVKISDFTVGKTKVYKSNINASSTVHYWFVKDNTTYTIYSWGKNPEIDSITAKLIESAS